MPLIYITGNSGSGKSTVRNELQKLGYKAHDTEEDRIGAYFSKQTDQQVERPADLALRTDEWYAQHYYMLPPQRIQALVDSVPQDEVVFLCGIAPNDQDVWHMFDDVIYLAIDEAMMKHRVLTRTNNSFGKSPSELEFLIQYHRGTDNAFHRDHAKVVDATQPLPKVVDNVLHHAKNLTK